MFTNKKHTGNSEIEYGQLKNLTIFSTDEKITFSVGEKYPLYLPNNEGESLNLASSLMINLFWRNINKEEVNCLKGVCQAISIYKNTETKVIVVAFIFSGKPIILSISDEESCINEWLRQSSSEQLAYFFLTEFNTKKNCTNKKYWSSK